MALTIRLNSCRNPQTLEFEDAASIPEEVQEVIGKQSWPLAEYKQLQDKLDELEDVQIDLIPQALCDLCKSIKREEVSDEEIVRRVGADIWTRASEYQREGVRYLIARNGRGILADDPGLGKTLQAIILLLYYIKKWPVLIVCPALPKLTWSIEIHAWLARALLWPCPSAGIVAQYLPLIQVLTSSKKTPQVKRFPITIVSYELLIRAPVRDYVLQRLKPRIMIVDESHYAKNEKAIRTVTVGMVAKQCDHVVLMSGTPLSRCRDLFAQLKCIYPQFFGRLFYRDYKEFKKWQKEPLYRRPFFFGEYFCEGTFRQQRVRGGNGNVVWLPNTSGCSRKELLHEILTEHILIQRRKKTVLAGELLPLERVRYMLPNSNPKAELEKKTGNEVQLRSYLFDQYHELGPLKAAVIGQFLSYFLAKFPEGEPLPKTLIWAHHYVVLDAIRDWAVENKVGYVAIDGSVPYPERVRMVDTFKTDSRVRIAILGLLACNTSLNLQVAENNIFAEMHWNVFHLQQAEDRCNRKGQTKAVTSYFVLMQNTLDQLLWRMANRNYNIATFVTQGAEEQFVAEYRKFVSNTNLDD